MVGESIIITCVVGLLLYLMINDAKSGPQQSYPKGLNIGAPMEYQWPKGYTGKLDNTNTVVEINGKPVKTVWLDMSPNYKFYVVYDNDRNWYFPRINGSKITFEDHMVTELHEKLDKFLKAMGDDEQYIIWKLGRE